MNVSQVSNQDRKTANSIKINALQAAFSRSHLVDRPGAHEGGSSAAAAVVQPRRRNDSGGARVPAGDRDGHAAARAHRQRVVVRRLRVRLPPGTRGRRAALLVVCGSCNE